MPSEITVYHNPRCSKSRATVEWLRQQNLDFQIVEYLKQPPDRATIESIIEKLDARPLEIMRKGEKRFKELGLQQGDHSDESLLDALVENPILLERPIVTTADDAAIGRPLENVMEIFDDL
jgi:arsenate reductase